MEKGKLNSRMQVQLPRSLEFITVKNLGGEPKGEKLKRGMTKQQIFEDLKGQVDRGEPLLLEIIGGVHKILSLDLVEGGYYIQTSNEQGEVIGKTLIDPDVARAELRTLAIKRSVGRTQRRRKRGKA